MGEGSAKVQMRRSRVQKCKGEKGGNVSGGGWQPQVAGGGESMAAQRETGDRMIGWVY